MKPAFFLIATLAAACSRGTHPIPTEAQPLVSGCPFERPDEFASAVLATVRDRDVITLFADGSRKTVHHIAGGQSIDGGSLTTSLFSSRDFFLVAAQFDSNGANIQELALIDRQGNERWQQRFDTPMWVASLSDDGSAALYISEWPAGAAASYFRSVIIPPDGTSIELPDLRVGQQSGTGWLAADRWTPGNGYTDFGSIRPSDRQFVALSPPPLELRNDEMRQWRGRRIYLTDVGGQITAVSELPNDAHLIALPGEPAVGDSDHLELIDASGSWLLYALYPPAGGPPLTAWKIDLQSETATVLQPSLPKEASLLRIDSAGRLLAMQRGPLATHGADAMTLQRSATGDGDWEQVSGDMGAAAYRLEVSEWSGTYLVRGLICPYCNAAPLAAPELDRDARRIPLDDLAGTISVTSDGTCAAYFSDEEGQAALQMINPVQGKRSTILPSAEGQAANAAIVWLGGR